MKSQQTLLEGAFVIQLNRLEDQRGAFVKTFNSDLFNELGLEKNFSESYFSVSTKNVIRGMHFQLPPHDHNKLVYVVEGTVIDVLLDLRKNSATFKKSFSIEISSANNKAMYIPRGVAHGFKVISDSATMVYHTSTVYNKESDTGIRWDSFGFDWNVKTPIISERDKNLIQLNDFVSPF